MAAPQLPQGMESPGPQDVTWPEASLTAGELARQLGCSDQVVAQLGVLWGKSSAGGRMNLLLCHLLDTAAVAKQMWHHYLSPRTRKLLDDLSEGCGQRWFMWLCGVHDCGKATPAFQAMVEELAQRVQNAGLTWHPAKIKREKWRHDKAGAKLLRDLLLTVWDPEHVNWVWPLVAGHHGSFPSLSVLDSPLARGEHQGRKAVWWPAQRAVVEVFTRALGFAEALPPQPVRVPNRAEQLELSGLIVMADWIASDERHFPGVDILDQVSLANSRVRAAAAWEALRLRGGWGELAVPTGDLISERFGDRQAREYQKLVVDIAHRMPGPGLMILEAPMGEGKTKAALAAAEILAARCGAHGVFVGMPTQATCDPMFSQVRKWARAFGGEVAEQTVLLHGKRMVNPEWRALLASTEGDPDDWYGGVAEDENDPYGVSSAVDPERQGPAQWFLGRKRGLLASLVVGTIDQLLQAATRTRHVMLRFAGLTGKVVILDEVHAADIYMEQFLAEALRWLGQARVPVLLLSATLPPRQRRALVEAYLAGATGNAQFTAEDMPEPSGYPNVTAAVSLGDTVEYLVEDSSAWRPSRAVAVEVLEDISNEPQAVVETVCRELAGGGSALVIHNTVDRAQWTFSRLREVLGDNVVLLHGRLCAGDRAERTERCLELLGREGAKQRDRSQPLVVVATQLAEQSFDIDADLLVTDLAPIDLLLQRIGRLHRHDMSGRPAQLAAPRVIVTGFADGDTGPRLLRSSESIYGRHRLLRAAALVLEATEGGWSIPDQVPSLVARAYGDEPVGPPTWGADAEAARQDWLREQEERARRAEPFLLARRGKRSEPTLAGLHYGELYAREEEFEALVRDGEPAVEVILVRRRRDGYTALNGVRIGVNGEGAEDVLDDVVAGMTRLPSRLTEEAETQLRPLDGWSGHPWLRHCRALVLDEDGWAVVGDARVTYHPLLGLVVDGGSGTTGGRG